ncbi:conserved hypothetical protein [Ricinus communis]|uniref:Uncharacterized protein n=1 Tax=Ricinus communis TaxID=3988 RepID=B9ST03_RICCO|nr:conserved hypothetical protein [Ricinus communis]
MGQSNIIEERRKSNKEVVAGGINVEVTQPSLDEEIYAILGSLSGMTEEGIPNEESKKRKKRVGGVRIGEPARLPSNLPSSDIGAEERVHDDIIESDNE